MTSSGKRPRIFITKKFPRFGNNSDKDNNNKINENKNYKQHIYDDQTIQTMKKYFRLKGKQEDKVLFRYIKDKGIATLTDDNNNHSNPHRSHNKDND